MSAFKTVNEQTLHRRSTIVPTSNRNQTKTSEFLPESAPLKEIISIWSRRADSEPNRNNLFSTRQIRDHYFCTADAELQRKSHLCIPRQGIALPQFQFSHSCVCERFICSQDGSTYFPASRIGRPILEIHKSLTGT
jgi:hypothetical protein